MRSVKHALILVSLYISVFLGLIFSLSTTLPVKKRSPQRRILIIHSYEPENNAYKEINAGIAKAFKAAKIQADLRFVYLNCERLIEHEELQKINNFLDSVNDWNPEIILVYDDQASYSLLASGNPLVRKIPIVFSGVNSPNWGLIETFPNVTGLWDEMEFIKTARFAESLFGMSHFRVWLDATFLGKAATRKLLRELKNEGVDKFGDAPLILNEDGSFIIDETMSRHRTFYEIPKESTFSMSNSRNGSMWELSGLSQYVIFMQCKRDYTTLRLGSFSSRPTMTVINEGVGQNEGLLGGYLTPIETEVRLSTQIVIGILNGADVSQIPIRKTPKEYVLDWEEMRRWKIDKSQIPSYCRIINMPPFERYKIEIILLGSISGAIVLLIIGYLFYLYYRENKKTLLAQDQQKKSEKFLSLALAGGKVYAFQLKDGYFHFDNDFFVSHNMELHPISLSEFETFLAPENIAKFYKTIESVFHRPNVQYTIQEQYKFDHITFQWWEFRFTYNESDRLLNGLCLNIQHIKEAEEELVSARQKAEESDKMKSAFLANMSHEIRTPLNAIVGFSNLINMEESELSIEEKRQFLELINTNCELLLKLINDILDLSRIESGRMDFVFSPCDLSVLMSEIYQTHRLLMPPGVELKMEIPAKAVAINVDNHRLRQVVTNFINNAAKFTRKGYIKIGYVYKKDIDSVLISVEDTGKGIPDNQQQAVFERFSKLDEFAQGTGLGLAICKVIIERFSGFISLKSKEGQGTCFTITLPVSIDKNHYM